MFFQGISFKIMRLLISYVHYSDFQKIICWEYQSKEIFDIETFSSAFFPPPPIWKPKFLLYKPFYYTHCILYNINLVYLINDFNRQHVVLFFQLFYK